MSLLINILMTTATFLGFNVTVVIRGFTLPVSDYPQCHLIHGFATFATNNGDVPFLCYVTLYSK